MAAGSIGTGRGAATSDRPAPPPEANLGQGIDQAPVPATVGTVVSKADITVAGLPACAFVVRYPGEVDHPVTWNGDGCAAIDARFVAVEELGRAGRLAPLDAETKADIERTPGGRVFYVAGGQRAAVYPLNVASVIITVPISE